MQRLKVKPGRGFMKKVMLQCDMKVQSKVKVLQEREEMCLLSSVK